MGYNSKATGWHTEVVPVKQCGQRADRALFTWSPPSQHLPHWWVPLQPQPLPSPHSGAWHFHSFPIAVARSHQLENSNPSLRFVRLAWCFEIPYPTPRFSRRPQSPALRLPWLVIPNPASHKGQQQSHMWELWFLMASPNPHSCWDLWIC